MADPKTGELASPEDFEVPADPNAPVIKEETGYVKTPADKARAEMARRAHKRRLAADSTFAPDVLEEDGTITPAPTAPITAPQQPLPEFTAPEALALPAHDTPEQAAGEPLPTTETSTPSAPPTAPVQPEETRELIVDGQRMRVPLSRILDAGTRALQKETAADMRLAAATELLKSAQERMVSPPVQQVTAQPSDEDAALARAIQFGTEDEAKAAIAKVRNATPAITPQQIEAYVQQSLAQKLPDHQAFNEANHWLRTQYSAITSDPDLKFLFDQKEELARKGGDRRPYSELYADLAGQMATKFNLKKAEVSQPPAIPINPTTPASDRITRKANSPRPVTGASGRLEQPKAPAKAPSVADYVTRQRQRRGLQPLEGVKQ